MRGEHQLALNYSGEQAMPQSLLTPQLITRKALESLENNLVMAKLVHRRFEGMFTQKIGTTLTVRKPNKFQSQEGPVIDVQDINEPSVSIVINRYRTVPFQFSDADMALTIEDFTERYIDPAMIPLANDVDFDLLGLASQFSNVVGTQGVTPTTFASSVQLTGQRLDENGVPGGMERNLVVNPAANWAMAGAQSNAFVTRVSEKALINGYLNQIGNQYVFMDQNVQKQATGSVYSGTSLSNGVAQVGATINSDGWGSGTTTLRQGTVITFAGVFAVNPVSMQSTGALKNFTITATISDTTGAIALPISPAIVTTGPFQNVTNAVADNSAVAVISQTASGVGNGPVNNLAFTKQAMGLCMVELPLPGGLDMAYKVTHKNISIRFLRGFDITNAQFISRLDILYGVAQYYDEMGVRLLG
ncbi:MAG TPA: P22 phage major capsid protein family protein [Pseudolabrys sp.]|nr:P22 phage major capsid protein family protein [Pseudolabrys sp.]